MSKGTYGRIASRSVLAVKHAIDIGTGVIDKDYRGPVLICLINNSDTDFQVKISDQIAQLILERISNPETKLVESLSLTERRTQGFGSTGSREILKSNKPLHGERLYFNARLRVKGKQIGTRLLLDCGATSPILREGFVKEHEILTKKRSNSIKIWNASQQPIAGAGRYYTQPNGLEIGNHSEALVWEVGVIEDSVDGYLPVASILPHRQLLPHIRFLKSFLDTNYSFRVLALRRDFTGPVLRQESPGALGFWESSLFIELYASCCWEQSSSSSPGNIFLSLGLKFRFGLVW